MGEKKQSHRSEKEDSRGGPKTKGGGKGITMISEGGGDYGRKRPGVLQGEKTSKGRLVRNYRERGYRGVGASWKKAQGGG